MNLVVTNTVNINEGSLIDYLHNLRPMCSLDEMMSWLSTKEGDDCLNKWIADNSNTSFETLDDFSYEELIDYIEYNF